MSITPSSGASSPDGQNWDQGKGWGQQNPQSGGQYSGQPGRAQGGYDPYAVPGHGAAPGYPAPHGAPGPQGRPVAVVNAKTPGLAVLLSFLWLGAGHLYAGRTTEGVVLLGVNFFLVLFLLVPLIGWVLSPLAWLGLFMYSAISSSNAVKQHNARWGVPRY